MYDRLLIIFAMMLVSFPVATADRFVPQSVGVLDAEIAFRGSVSSSTSLDILNVSTYVVPRYVSSPSVSTEYTIQKDSQGNDQIVMTWNNAQDVTYVVEGNIHNVAQLDGAKRVPFPYSPPREVWPYLADTENSPITDEIRQKALELTDGAATGFDAVVAISTWISPVTNKNFKYDRAYGNKIYPADEVLQNKAGVCDEFTNLMVAMSRAVGIPARSVAGVIYAPDGTWGYHAWAEVYLDDWVPVDSTWNEVGWLDASHIELAKFKDGGDVQSKAVYLTRSRPSLSMTSPSVEVSVTSSTPIRRVFDTSFESYPMEIGLGDSAVVEVRTTSSSNGCIATGTELLSRVDPNGRPAVSVSDPVSLAVCPGEESKAHFILDASNDLQKGFVYTKVADISTYLGESVPVNVVINPNDNDRSSLSLTVDSTIAKKGDRIGFSVSSDVNYRVYSDLPVEGDSILAATEGLHYVIAASETGEVEKREIEVKREIDFRITNVRKPLSLTCGQQANVTFDIENLKDSQLNIQVKIAVSDQLSSVNEQTRSLGPGESLSVMISSSIAKECSPNTEFMDVVVNDQRVHAQFPVSDLEGALEAFRNLLMKIILFIKALIQL